MTGQPERRRTRRWWSLAFAALAVVAACLFDADGGLTQRLAGLGTPSSADALEPLAVLGSWRTPLLSSLVLLGLWLLLDWSRLARLSLGIAGSGVLAAGAVALLGWGLRAVGPGWESAPWIAGPSGGFPSLQAALAVAFLTSLVAGCGWLLTAGAWLLAVLAGLQAVLHDDAGVASLVVGACVGWAAVVFMRRLTLAPSDPGPAPEPSVGRVLLGLALVLGPLLFLELGGLGFGDPDEGRYASIPYEMTVRGDYVTPTLNYLVYFEKPPLLYWCVAGMFKLFGPSEWSARLVPVTASIVGVLLTLVLGRSMFGARGGRLSATVLATCPIWLAMGRFLVTDMLFSVLVFACITMWWCSHVRKGGARAALDAAFWVLLGLAVLCKGPLAGVLVFGTIGTYALVCRQLKDLFRPRFFALAVLGVAVAAPWFVAVSLRNPGFDHEFWYMQHLARFLGSEDSGMHEAGPLFFLPYLPAMFVPWALLLPAALWFQRRESWPPDTLGKRGGVLLAWGCSFMLLFFSASTGKLQIYLLPMLPLLAVGTGGLLDRLMARLAEGAAGDAVGERAAPDAHRIDRQIAHWMGGSARVGGVLLLLGAVACVVAGTPPLRELEARGPGLAIGMAVVLTGCAIALFRTVRRGDITAIASACAGGAAAVFFAMTLIAVALMPNHSVQPLIDYIRPGLEQQGQLVTFRGWMQSLSFYTDRRIHIFHQSGEFEFGLGELPEKERALWYGEELSEVAALLDSPGPVYCMFKDREKALRALENLDGLACEIIWNHRRAIVGNAAAAQRTPPLEGGLLGERWQHFD